MAIDDLIRRARRIADAGSEASETAEETRARLAERLERLASEGPPPDGRRPLPAELRADGEALRDLIRRARGERSDDDERQ